MKSKFFLLVLTLSCFGCAVSGSKKGCVAPASAIKPQVYDLCLLKNETDDIANPDVQKCLSVLATLPDDCEYRLLIKKQRCARLIEGKLLENLSLDQCIASAETEGYFVKGCKYPFNEDCLKKVKKKGEDKELGY